MEALASAVQLLNSYETKVEAGNGAENTEP